MSCGSRTATKASTSSSASRRFQKLSDRSSSFGFAGGTLLGHLGADPLQRAPEDARDVHLGMADPLRDERLRQAVDEAQPQDQALALIKMGESPLQRQFVLDQLV